MRLPQRLTAPEAGWWPASLPAWIMARVATGPRLVRRFAAPWAISVMPRHATPRHTLPRLPDHAPSYAPSLPSAHDQLGRCMVHSDQGRWAGGFDTPQ